MPESTSDSVAVTKKAATTKKATPAKKASAKKDNARGNMDAGTQ